MEYNQELSTAHWPGSSGKGRLIQAGVVNGCKPVDERNFSLLEDAACNKSGEVLV
jgi:hypothetical protein